uniref:HVA22-like protein n=1 Tax=Steinernema glaseri TaxID=37863 RepID=A0A1I7Y7N3_9BILA
MGSNGFSSLPVDEQLWYVHAFWYVIVLLLPQLIVACLEAYKYVARKYEGSVVYVGWRNTNKLPNTCDNDKKNREVAHIRKPSLIICLRNAKLYREHVCSIEALQSGNAEEETKRIAAYIKDVCDKSVDILENKMSTANPTWSNKCFPVYLKITAYLVSPESHPLTRQWSESKIVRPMGLHLLPASRGHSCNV